MTVDSIMREIRIKKSQARVRGDRNGLWRRTSKFNADHGDFPLMNDNSIMLGANDYRDLYVSRFIESQLKKGCSVITDALTVKGSNLTALAFLEKCYTKMQDVVAFSGGINSHVVVFPDSIVEVHSNSNTIDFRLHGEFSRIHAHRKQILEHFEEITVFIDWIYDQHMNTVKVPIDSTLLPVTEMYPFLDGESLENYYDRYSKSSASILILIGPPGTGKTSFIRGFLSATQASALVTYDQKILSNDSLFSDFIGGSASALIIEDADLFLSSRKDGNDMMHRFLNVGDGLVTVKGKKMIFSTNLPSIKDIDEALLRPGRCFDILHFGELNRDEAEAIVERMNINYKLPEGKGSFTLSEIFSRTKNESLKTPGSRFGFNQA